MKRKPYASGTDVPIRKTRQEIINLLEAADITDYGFRSTSDGTELAFILQRYQG